MSNQKYRSLFLKVSLIILLGIIAPGCSNSESNSNNTAEAQPPAPDKATSPVDNRPVIVAFGDSITAGFGLSEEESYTSLLQKKIDEKGFKYRVVNAGISGDTSAGGVRRIEWTLQQDVKFLILELGGNDALRGQPVSALKANLAKIIEASTGRGATVILAGMEAPPNLGEDYTREFRRAYRDLAKKYNLVFIPFVLDGVGGLPEMNQPDGIHPNAEGEKVLTENVWRVLEPLLKSQRPQ